MPKVRKAKSTAERAEEYCNLGDTIIALGAEAMAPCPQCTKAGVVCVIRKGYKRCGPCTKKNMSCGGNFSKAEFDRLDKKKFELRQQSEAGQTLMAQLVAELLKTQKKVADAERRIAVLHRRQERMADREARALGELEDGGSSEEEAAVMDVDPFFWEDPSFDAVVFSDPAFPLDLSLVAPEGDNDQSSGGG